MFEPKGDRPEWQLLYEALLQGVTFGDVITYDALDRVLGRPFVDHRAPLYRAREELAAQHRRWLEVVPRVGYRVIAAHEHVSAALQRKRRARRQMQQMVRIGNATDVTALTPEQLVVHDQQHRLNAMLLSVVVNHEQRLARIEDALHREGLL